MTYPNFSHTLNHMKKIIIKLLKLS